MSPHSLNALFRDGSRSDSWEDGELLFSRGWRENTDGSRQAVLLVLPATEHPTPASLDRLAHEYALRDMLDPAWAVKPLALEREGGRTTLLLNDGGGQPLARFLGAPLEIGVFLRLAVSITSALGKVHQHGLVHKDLKPAHILVMDGGTEVRLTGFGLASRLSRELHAPEPPDVIAGTLAYMAPEQTGRMNRATDSRSDLYALGVTLYELMTGTLPFTTSDPIELIHCHIAREPAPPNVLAARAPEQVSSIVMKLLAKAAEDRYQTAAGLEADLRTCLSALEETGRIEPFPLAASDAPDRLLIPERIYGRESQVATLLTAFDRVASGGETQVVLVSGYSGIGKSSVVNELHKVIVLPRGIFISGKFDQRSRDIPYATVAEAFQGLIRQILNGKSAEIARWRDSILEAIGANGRLLTDLIPELIRMIGPQPELPDLAPFDAQLRFQAVLQRFVGVFAQREHPLLIFIDDLQWLDPATLAFIEQLAIDSDIGHLLLIGAYRDNEVGLDHMLFRTMAAIRQAGTPVEEIALGPISLADVTQLVADTLRCPPTRAHRLAGLIYRKTGGNPFFAVQFLTNLAEEALIRRDPKTHAWTWDLEGIDAKGFTDNLVDLMVGRLRRLPSSAQDALKLLACLGSNAEIATLELVLGAPKYELNESLRVAVQAGIIVSRGGHYRFLHDRVQEAAYALIPDARRPALHFHAGQRLLAALTDDEVAERIFDIVNQLNLGVSACNDPDEKARIARLNLQAGLRAKASTAYASACSYFASGLATLGDQGWEQAYELAFKLLLERAECELSNANSAVSAELIELLLANARTKTDRTEGFRLRITLQLLHGDMALALRTALECLKMFEMTFSERPTAEDVREEYHDLQRRIGSRPIENLIDLPLMEDPEIRALSGILVTLGQSSYFVDHHLYGILTCRMIKLSIDFGHSASGILGYGGLGIILGPTFGRFEDGERFARVAVAVTERHDFLAHRPAAYVILQMTTLWTRTIDEALACLDVADKAAAETGEVVYASLSAEHRITNQLARGDRLDLIWPESINALTFVRKKGYAHIIDILLAIQCYIATLRGDTSNDNLICDEATLLRTGIPVVQCFYWILQLQLRYLMGDPVAALEAAENAKPSLWSARCHIQAGTFQFYHALALLAVVRSAPTSEPNPLRESLKESFATLQTLADTAPHTYAHKRDLAVAEFAGLEGRDSEAMRLYEQAVRSALEKGFIQEAALGAELAANFFAGRGLERIAQSYRCEARDYYRRWGALGKVAQLDRRHPEAAPKVSQPHFPTVETSLEHLDLATVIRMSQAVAGELLLDRLIETLMTIAIEHAGADRGLLVLPHGDDLRVEAEAKSTAKTVSVRLVGGDAPAPGLPATVLAHVRRTQQPVILDDARAKTPFSSDGYLRRNRVRSVLCLPLVKQGKLSGMFYLENSLASHVFTPARITVLMVLSSQAAISLENTRLYNDLAEREARIRRLVDANIIGIAIGNLDGLIREANDAFLRTVGYDRDDLVTGRLLWTDLRPSEPLDSNARRGIPDLGMAGTLQPYEDEFVRKDGRQVPVLVGGALFQDGGPECVVFMLDLTASKRAERALRELESDLAHMNRLSVMGELAASLAHELKQPIGSARNNARAALNFLKKRLPDLGEVKEALDCVVGDADRTADIIDRLRDHIKKAPPRRDWFDLNNAIDEIVVLAHSALSKNEVTVQTRLRDGLSPVRGDRVQLQQVVLNLILNAVEAMSSVEGGERELLITTEPSQTNGTLVAVKDSGPGIDPEQLDRVFEAFYTTKSSGLGMGLSICRSIIKAHGGRLWAAPNEPRGALFQFTLPNAEWNP
ncbi:trifunctional serine/threonine-protein kinase/ATP-binding protein/sensor histidine kinase [Bradyrhizobium sp. 6(2017)]|uniref:trifunctional serine/threonine-protein kinase/ATP-binding protein/sensor histidine kinase n=1 Tax=Bradyrhizobium sp. 6(2017) TaxID=1197460 RepID=UPI0013E0F39B|nr:trifunctional serine/threonine-protein kinase/ATP-binding protein/sensor histidine kinase [Bradyrhizobium sp. 6(2017)]QIG95956.1 AAA family ATPase [Bradyrhizobium sp. 6(2017)]